MAARRRRRSAGRLRRGRNLLDGVAAPPPRRRRPPGHHRPAAARSTRHSAAALWANLRRRPHPVGWRRLLYGSPHVVWQYTWTGRHLLISVWVPGTVPPGAVEAAVRAAWPGATVTTDRRRPPPIPADGRPRRPAGTAAQRRRVLPLRTDHDADPLRPLLAAGAQVAPASTPACRSWPAPPPRGGRRRARARPPGGCATARPPCRPSTRPRRCCGCSSCSCPGRPPAATARRGRRGRRDPVGRARRARDPATRPPHPLCEIAIRYAVAATSHRHATRRRPAAGPAARASPTRSPRRSPSTPARNRLAHRARMPHPVAVLAGAAAAARVPAATAGTRRAGRAAAGPGRARPGPGARQADARPGRRARPAGAASRCSATPRSAATPSA